MRSAARVRLAVAAAASALASAACAGFSLQELPPQPVAFIYRTGEEAAKRAQLLEPKDRRVRAPGHSVVRLDQVEGFLDRLAGETPEKRLADTIGRLSLFYPGTGKVVPLPVASRGSRPVDWSPDHSVLYYSSLRNGVPQVFAYNLRDGTVERITPGHEAHGYASLGPDGRVAFSRTTSMGRRVDSQIWLIDADGTQRALTQGPADYRPRFSPRGDAILYSSYLPSGEPAIFRIELEGTGEPRLVARGTDPDFASDGSWVVFSQKINGRWHIWRMKPDGTGKYAIGGAPNAVEKLDAVEPTVSPDGRYIVYVSEEGTRQQLRVRRADGTGDRPLLEGADGGDPVW